MRLEDWNRRNRTFEAISGYYVQDVSEASGELPERLRQARVAPRFLGVIGIDPAVGRGFTEEEMSYGGPAVALVSDRFWRRRFGADPAAIGRVLELSGNTATPYAATSKLAGSMTACSAHPSMKLTATTAIRSRVIPKASGSLASSGASGTWPDLVYRVSVCYCFTYETSRR